jgi:type I restriction enzyme M protein
MMAETGREDVLPNGYRWNELTKRTGLEQLDYYKRLLLDLGTKGKARVAAIFADARTMLRKPTNLKALTDAIDELDWFSAREDGLGNLYEGLLVKNAAENKSGAGQHFTPRPLIDCIVRLMEPQRFRWPSSSNSMAVACRLTRLSCSGWWTSPQARPVCRVINLQ